LINTYDSFFARNFLAMVSNGQDDCKVKNLAKKRTATEFTEDTEC